MSKSNRFALSAHGKIALCVGIALASSQTTYASDIVSVGGTDVYTKNGVTIVNINQANAQGLSHNKYNKYNVGQQGAVLNNSTKNGNSELAGRIKANNKLNNTAAKVILNEVVSKQPSTLLGKQEVFGQKADYVLANPNGITCDGCGFINTPNAALVVGKANVKNGKIQSLTAGDNGNNNALKTRGEVVTDGSVTLVAPTVTVAGNIKAKNAVNVISGRQTVDYNNLDNQTLIISHTNDEDVPVLDGKVVGSIQAGRIRIHHNDEKAKLTVNQAQLTATDDARVKSRGHVDVVASTVKAGKTASISGKTVDIRGKVHNKSDSGSNNHYNWWTTERTQSKFASNEQTLTQSEISGYDVSINGEKQLELSAVKVKATRDVKLGGGNVAVGATKTRNTNAQTNGRSKGLWHNTTTVSNKDETLHTSELSAGRNVGIQATGNVRVKATTISADRSINIKAGKQARIDAGVARKERSNINDYKNETAKLKTGQNHVSSTKETLVGSTLETKGILSVSGETVTIDAATLSADTLKLAATGELNVGVQGAQNNTYNSDSYTYWGGIGGGNTDAAETKSMTYTQSNLSARNIVISGEQGVTLTAANVAAGTQLAVTSDKGKVAVKHAQNHSKSLTNTRHGTAFNITDKSKKVAESKAETLSSVLTSGNAIRLSGNEVDIVGSRVEATGLLTIAAANTVSGDVADAQHTVSTENFHIGTSTYTKADGKNLTGEAGAKLQGITHTVVNGSGTATANTLKGSQVTISSGDRVHLKGSQIQATGSNEIPAGKITITGDDVVIAAGKVRGSTKIDYTKANGATVYVKGSLEKIAIGAKIGTEQSRTVIAKDNAVVSKLTAYDVMLTGKKLLENQGTVIVATNAIKLLGETVNNFAAHDVTHTHKIDAEGGVTAELYAKVSPNVGVALTLGGEGKGTKGEKKDAVVSQFSAKNIVVSGISGEAKRVKDAGTLYNANQKVGIYAYDYLGHAAQDSDTAITNTGMGEIGIDVSTSDFSSVSITLSGAAAHQHLEVGDIKAKLGHIKAANVDIRATNTIANSMMITAENRADLIAGKSADIIQADNVQWAKRYGFDFSGSVGVDYTPPKTVTPSFSISVAGNYAYAKDSQAVTTTLKAGDIVIKGGKTASLQGATIKADNRFALTADKVTIDAASDYHTARGYKGDGNASLSLTIGKGVKGGSFGLGANFAMVKEDSVTQKGANIQAENVAITATDSVANNLRIVGAKIKADVLKISNVAGRVLVEAAKSTVKKGNWGIGGNVGASVSSKSVKSFKFGGHLDIDYENSYAYNVGSIEAGKVLLNSGGDFTLQSDVKADEISGHIGGNVTVASAQDHKNAFKFNTAMYVSAKPHKYTSKTTVADIAKNIHKDYQSGTIFGVKAGVKLDLDVKNNKTTQVTEVRADKLNLNVGGGNVAVQAASVESNGGSGFGNATISQTDNVDHKHELGVKFALRTPNFKKMFTQLITNQEVEKPIEVGGHLDWEDNKVVKSDVKLR